MGGQELHKQAARRSPGRIKTSSPDTCVREPPSISPRVGGSSKSGPPAKLNRPRAGELPQRVRRGAVRVGRRRSPHGRTCVRSTGASRRELPNSPVSESRGEKRGLSFVVCWMRARLEKGFHC